MLKLAQIYTNIEELKIYIKKCGFNYDTHCLVKIFTTILNEDDSVALAEEIKGILPNAKIAGSTSSSAVIFEGKQYENSTIILIEVYERLDILVETFTYDDKTPAELAKDIHQTFYSKGLDEKALVHILFSDLYPEVNAFINETNKLSPKIMLVGGVAGYDYSDTQAGFVFTENGIIKNGAIAFTATSKYVHSFCKFSSSMEPISVVHTLDKLDGTHIETIDGTDALTWMYNFLEVDISHQYSIDDWTLKANNDFLTHFPLIIEGMYGAARYTFYDNTKNKLSTYFSRLDNGTKFKIGYVNPSKTIRSAYELCTEIIDYPVESIFIYSCLFRKLYLSNCAEWEITPFDQYKVCGLFMMGEISHQDGLNLMHNGAFVFTSVAESEKYIIPNMSALENVSAIEQDKTFLETAQLKGKELVKNSSSLLMDKIKKYDSNFYDDESLADLDMNFKLSSFYQYEKDKRSVKEEKVCVAEIITADTTIAFIGQEKYFEACNDILDDVKAVIRDELGGKIKLYAINYKNILIMGGDDLTDDEFIDCMRKVYEKFEHTSSPKTGVAGVIRYVTVVNQSDKLNKALNILYSNKDIQDNFLISIGETTESNSSIHSLQMIEVLNRAIRFDNVVPYYQGIYNNLTGKIDKYEALMRIVDNNGKIYTPYTFLEVSKSYKFYNKISQMLIKKVLNDFKARDERVSINISYYDIVSKYFTNWFLEEIKNYPNPQNLIIEFVETESYQDLDALLEFIEKIRVIGAKIAVDDFGAGYSTFSNLLAIKPNYIKIDGSIVANLTSNPDNIIILDTIRYMATQMRTEIIAEFVETESIQKIIKEHNVSHSQGFYFSKPAPIEEIK